MTYAKRHATQVLRQASVIGLTRFLPSFLLEAQAQPLACQRVPLVQQPLLEEPVARKVLHACRIRDWGKWSTHEFHQLMGTGKDQHVG